MAKGKRPTCPICKKQILLQLYDHKYLYPWNGDNRIGKNVHKGCIEVAIEEGIYKEPKKVKVKYDFKKALDEEDIW